MIENSFFFFGLLLLLVLFFISGQSDPRREIMERARNRSLSMIDLAEYNHLHPKLKEMYRRSIVERVLPKAFDEMTNIYGKQLAKLSESDMNIIVDHIVAISEKNLLNVANKSTGIHLTEEYPMGEEEQHWLEEEEQHWLEEEEQHWLEEEDQY